MVGRFPNLVVITDPVRTLTLPPPALESYRSGAPQAKIQLTNSRARHSCSAARPLYAPGFDIFQGANG